MDQTQETFGMGFSAILVPRWDKAGQLRVENLSHLAPEGRISDSQLCYVSRKTGAWYLDLLVPEPWRFPVVGGHLAALCPLQCPVAALLQPLLPL